MIAAALSGVPHVLSLEQRRLEELVDHRSLLVREAALRASIRCGLPVRPNVIHEKLKGEQNVSTGRTGVEALLVDVYLKMPDTELEQTFNSLFDIDGPIAYFAWAARERDRTKNVRENLLDGFAKFWAQAFDNVRKGFQGAEDAWSAFSTILANQQPGRLERFTRDEYISWGLRALAITPEPSDAALARKYLLLDPLIDPPKWNLDARLGSSAASDFSDRETRFVDRLPAISILQRFGNQQDVNALLIIAERGPEAERIAAATAALVLDAACEPTLTRLVGSDKPRLVSTALAFVQAHWDENWMGVLCRLLRDQRAEVRLSALAVISQRSDKARLEDLARTYRADAYYYDVGGWLDRLVYSPEPLATRYLEDLKDRYLNDDTR